MDWRTLDNDGQPWWIPGETLSEGEQVSVAIARTNGTRGPVVDPLTGEQIAFVGTAETNADGVFAIRVPVTAGLSPAAELVITRQGQWGRETYRVQVPPGTAALKWSELVDLGSTVSDVPVSALDLHTGGNTHLTVAERQALDASPTPPSASNPIATAADIQQAGGGDMSSLIYDPDGVASNAFDLANQTGALDGGNF